MKKRLGVSSFSSDCLWPISPPPACSHFPSQWKVAPSTSPFIKDRTAAETMPIREKRLLQPPDTSHLAILIFSSRLSVPVTLKLALGVKSSCFQKNMQAKRQGFLFRCYCCFQSSSLMLFLVAWVLMLWSELLGFPFANIK